MKKVLLVLGVCALFAACSKSDCNCTAESELADVNLYTEDTPTITDYDGDCADVTKDDLTSNYAAMIIEGVTLKCVED
ncbi:MAG: hypothetical protein LBR17_09805 [Bacteroidales bacterium]|jgi:hypothetical protein|nr:hypothetical protein [Bacteroidales bacterium]